jgi:hypothetical protein
MLYQRFPQRPCFGCAKETHDENRQKHIQTLRLCAWNVTQNFLQFKKRSPNMLGNEDLHPHRLIKYPLYLWQLMDILYTHSTHCRNEGTSSWVRDVDLYVIAIMLLYKVRCILFHIVDGLYHETLIKVYNHIEVSLTSCKLHRLDFWQSIMKYIPSNLHYIMSEATVNCSS